MNLEDFAALTGKSIPEVKAMLKEQEIVELKLSDKVEKNRESGSIIVVGSLNEFEE